MSDTLIDTLFDGRYRILRKLGQGGMADVYLAEDQELGRRVAIKILNDRHAGDDQFVERFRREATHAASLSHPNIVAIYDRGEAEGTYYIAMEHLDGRNLKELIVARGPAPVRVAVEYARQILAALRHAHRHAVVHRDIKPHNIIVDPDGRVKVTDFGIARVGNTEMTEAGSIVGTAQYLSPEQAKGTSIDQRSDLYSLGIVLYELLTGTAPFTGDSPVEIAMKHLSDTPRSPSEVRPEIPRDLDLVVLRALAKDPAARYADADEMDADLERVQRGVAVSHETVDAATAIIRRPAPATAPTAVTRVATPASAAAAYRGPAAPPAYYDYEERVQRRRPIWPWLLAALLVAAALVAGFYVLRQFQEQLDASKPVAVPLLVGTLESLAVGELIERDLDYQVIRRPTEEQPVGYVYEQDPAAGKRVDRETDIVTVYVSAGKPKRMVPTLRGRSRDEAVQLLTERRLKPKVVEVNSLAPVNTVTAQTPKAGSRVVVGTVVRINVSKGPKPVAVPSVVGESFESANSQLQAAGFSVARRDVESNDPAGTVVGQDPAPGSTTAKGATVTLAVSEGPKTTAVPSVENLDAISARAALREAGFKVAARREPTDDPNLDGVVIAQDPAPETQAKPGSTVTITVGEYQEPEPEPEPEPTETTTP